MNCARLEFEILSEGLTEATLWNKCHENSGHTGFFLASEFTSASLPDEYRSDATYSECIHLMSELTVKLRINHTSCSRPDDDPVSKYRSILGVTRTCTGFLSYYNLRDWASLFETFCILKQNPKLDNNDVQRQDNFFQNDIEFDLKRVRDHVKKKMNVFQLSEQDVDQIGNECLRELCLQAWAAVQAYSRNASLELFEKMLLHNVALCVFAGVEDLNDMLDIPQDILENMPQSVVNDCDDDNLEKEVSQEDMLHQRDLSNKSSLDSIDDILGYPTKNSTDNSTNNISDDTTNNRSDDVTNSKPDNSTNNRSDDEINSKADNSTNNRTDDQTNDTSVFLIKNSSTDSVNNIVNDTTYNESVSSTNVLGDVRKVQSVDPIKSMSNETKNNSLEDPGKSRLVCSTIRDYYNQANMLAHSTNASSSDSDSNISDDGTKDGWDDAVKDTLNDPKDDNLGSDVEESEHSLMSILPCSCPECLRSGCPEKAGYLFSVVTDRRAIFDKEEATRTVVDIVWGEQVIHLYGQTPEEVSENSDLKYLVCVTHELDVARKIRKLCTQFEKVYKNMPAKREGLLAVICSYPHGFSKMISIGEWTARYLHPCGQNPPMTYVSYQYTTPTCPGSIGAPVLVLGQKSNMQQIRSEIQCHYGKLSGHLNRSGIGFGFDYS